MQNLKRFLLYYKCFIILYIYVHSVIETLGHEYDTDKWRLFIDSSKVSLKAVLLYNGNKIPSVPLAHATNMKESYDNIKLILEKIKYNDYKWNICGKTYYEKNEWPKRTSLTPGNKNVINILLVHPQKMPPLHIKLRLMKNFVKGMDKTGNGFAYVRNKFPKISDAKLKEGIFKEGRTSD